MEEDDGMESSPMDQIFSWNESRRQSKSASKRRFEEDSGCYSATPSSSQSASCTISWTLGTSDEGFCESPRGKQPSWETCSSLHIWDEWERNAPLLPNSPEVPIPLPVSSPTQPKVLRSRDIPRVTASYNSSKTGEFSPDFPLFHTPSHRSKTDFIHLFAVASDLRHVLSHIFSYLSDSDITMMTMVSKTWYDVITKDKNTRKRWLEHVTVRKLTKENLNCVGSSSMLRSPLKAVNHSTPLHNPPSSPSPPCSPSSFKFNLYVKEAKKLKEGEWLMHCPSCDLPCKCTPIEKLAKCVRIGCSMEFCTDCRSPYHRGSPCVLLSPPGSRTPQKRISKLQSRKNLRRLL